jgi:DNA-binding MarR family transcriptional regulator
VSRSQWQVLNSIHEAGHITKEQLFETMQTFISQAELERILTDFSGRGWLVQTEKGLFQLSGEGRAEYQHILELQEDVRKRAMRGVTEEEYMTVIRVLQRIVNNLEGKSS